MKTSLNLRYSQTTYMIYCLKKQPNIILWYNIIQYRMCWYLDCCYTMVRDIDSSFSIQSEFSHHSTQPPSNETQTENKNITLLPNVYEIELNRIQNILENF